MDLIIDEAIIQTKLKAVDSASVICSVGEKLVEAGLVQDDFIEAVVRREEKYPTGLPTSIPVALCHTDPEYVKRSFLALATLDEPVPFHEMGNPEQIQQVGIVFFLGIADKNGHMDVLKRIMKLIQDPALLRAIHAAGSSEEIKLILLGCLQPDQQ